MLELKNIAKIYNPGEITESCLFEHFSLNIGDGDFVSVVGSNGSGKTSLLNIICGSVPADAGEILLDGRDISKIPEYRRYAYIGRVYQNPAVGSCPDLTILENLAMADNKGKKYGFGPGVNKKRAGHYRELLSSLRLGLEDKLNVQMSSLSGGQRQAMSLLMATMTPIRFLILDEHTAALDPKTAELIMELTDRIIREKKLTALMVTHNLRYAVQYGNRMIMLHQGKIVFERSGEAKAETKVEDILSIFNKISIECGN